MKGRNAFDDFGFSKDMTRSRMKLYPLNLLHELSVFHKNTTQTFVTSTDVQSTNEPAAKITKNNELGDDRLPNPLAVTESVEESSHVIDDVGASFIPRKGSADCQNVDITSSTPDAVSRTQSELSPDIKMTVTPPGDKTSSIEAENSNQNNSNKSLKITRSEYEGERERPIHLMEREAAKLYIENTEFDTLVVAVKARPTQLVLRLLTLVKLSRPFVVYHQHKEPLLELFVQLKERGGVVNLKLSESWFRTIQVLPERTHPAVNMSGTSGYLLTGTNVERC